MRYLLVTPIGFSRSQDGSVTLDGLWAEDLTGLVSAIGPVVVAAPELPASKITTWGTGYKKLTSEDQMIFIGLPSPKGRWDFTFRWRVRPALRRAVVDADIVHSSNLFAPYTPLWYGHDLAVRLHKKTLFVVAEDFYDMLNWEWVRTASNWIQRLRRRRMLRRLDLGVRRRVANASLTFLHTPAAVSRYREYAGNAVAIRQPVHDREDVISRETLESKCVGIGSADPLKIVTACRLEPLKGLNFLLRAVAILKQRNVFVQAIIYGNGGQLNELQLLARNLDIAGQVRFPGSLPLGPSLRLALSSSHIFAMPHLTADFGRAFFDAMAAGCPVVAFRSISSQDTVRHRSDGLVTANADAEALADAIAEFHYDREFLARASRAAHARALANTKRFWHDFRAQLTRELFCPTSDPHSASPSV
jgi:glycosyltransferase involved in cell wall biosynthesis